MKIVEPFLMRGVNNIFWNSLLVTTLIFTGCKNESQPINSENNQNDISISETDLLKYKVKEEKFQNDPLKLSFNKIILEKNIGNDYSLFVEGDLKMNNLKEIEKYYLVLSIYPYDKEIDLLSESRQKYGFEIFSMHMKPSVENGKIIAKRRVKTRLKRMRAITLSVMEYETKKKIKEVVMLNIKLK